MKSQRWTILTLTALAVGACDRAPSGEVVARAAGHELDVAEATEFISLLAADIPAGQPAVVMAVADLWIDYTLLATAAAQDSTLSQVDLEPLIRQQQQVEMISALRDSVIRVDTALTDAQVRERFVSEAPGARVRARHILVRAPQGATQAQRDSARSLADDLLERLRAGENFEALARQYSDDVTAEQGGDLGFFGRGEMLPQFDSAAFALETGQISDVVTTIYGHHIVRVDEKETPDFETLAGDFRRGMQAEMFIRAESLYVTGLENRAGLEITEGAADVVREIAQNPLARLSGRASGRSLVEFEGGELTVEELRTFMQTRDPGYRQQVGQATAQQIDDNVLKALAQRKLLIAEAVERGIAPSEARQDSLVREYRSGFRDAALALGLVGIGPAQGESLEDAIERAVSELVRAILLQERDVIPLGAVTFALRQQYDVEIFEAGLQSVVQQVQQASGPAEPNPFGLPPQGQPSQPTTPPDTVGGTP